MGEEKIMSIGIGAHASLVLLDENTVIYEYGGYNLNELEYRNAAHVCDGSIMIQRCCFPEPEIYEKLKKLPGGKKKLITKRIPVDVDYSKMIADGLIEIRNCSNCWQTTDDEKRIDIMALHILFYLFKKYAEEGKLPEYISYNV